uniref:Cysteine-rich DPF motif domain-containing protein 1 n=1 Tax=Piliocolobus tephrosceles TaxID=591936 RepID=A0A8C9GEU4_9PRIM
MASHAECRALGVFECELYALTARYIQSIVLLEESYVMKDPFISDKVRFLVLGWRCSLCIRLKTGKECTFFYFKRFCLPCVQENIVLFLRKFSKTWRKGKSSWTSLRQRCC